MQIPSWGGAIAIIAAAAIRRVEYRRALCWARLCVLLLTGLATAYVDRDSVRKLVRCASQKLAPQVAIQRKARRVLFSLVSTTSFLYYGAPGTRAKKRALPKHDESIRCTSSRPPRELDAMRPTSRAACNYSEVELIGGGGPPALQIDPADAIICGLSDLNRSQES